MPRKRNWKKSESESSFEQRKIGGESGQPEDGKSCQLTGTKSC